MNNRRIWIYAVPVLGIIVIGIGLYLASSTLRTSGPPAPDGLVLLSDQTMRNPVETPDIEHESGVIGRFQRRTGIRVQAEYAFPEALIDEVNLTDRGDLLLLDEFHMEKAVQAGLVGHVKPVARLVPVILVQRGNPHHITGVPDLSSRDIRLAVADEQTSVMGRVTLKILQKNGVSWTELKHAPLVTDTEYEAAMAVNNRRADAAIIWKNYAGAFSRRIGIVEIPEEKNIFTRLKIGVLESSQNSEQAQRFAEFVASPAALELFEMYGFDVDRGNSER